VAPLSHLVFFAESLKVRGLPTRSHGRSKRDVPGTEPLSVPAGRSRETRIAAPDGFRVLSTTRSIPCRARRFTVAGRECGREARNLLEVRAEAVGADGSSRIPQGLLTLPS